MSRCLVAKTEGTAACNQLIVNFLHCYNYQVNKINVYFHLRQKLEHF
jgi:hypothetical protein